MNEILPAWPLLATFLFASALLAVTPGPAVLYIVTRSLGQGRRSGLVSVPGVALGNLGNALGAAVGLGALFAVSSAAFAAVKYAGAAYLVYLGIRTLRSPPAAIAPGQPGGLRPWLVTREGFLVALLNPKTAVFFAAFLPQFMDSATAPMIQSIALGTLFVAIAAGTDTLYALAAGAIAPRLVRNGRVQALGRYLTGGAFIGLGLFTAAGGTRR